jgi:hypothetical protein
MSAYLIVTIALLPVSPIMNVAARVHNRFLTKFGVDTKNDEELGVAMIAGSVAIMIICLAFYALIICLAFYAFIVLCHRRAIQKAE